MLASVHVKETVLSKDTQCLPASSQSAAKKGSGRPLGKQGTAFIPSRMQRHESDRQVVENFPSRKSMFEA